MINYKECLNQYQREEEVDGKKFPIYIYPLQVTLHSEHAKTDSISSEANQLANLAKSFFSYGDEQKALLVYKQILYNNSQIFNKDPSHLWALAESQLGQENFTLSEGYYSSIIKYFPESHFAELAEVRLLDIKAIRLYRHENYKYFSQLAEEVNVNSNTTSSSDILAHKNKSYYWSNVKDKESSKKLPLLNKTQFEEIRKIYSLLPQIEHLFLSSLLLKKNTHLRRRLDCRSK